MRPKYCRTFCPRPIQPCEWVLGILEKGWEALREVWGGLGAVLRLCLHGVLWDATSSPWSVILCPACQGTEGAGGFPLDLLVGCFWGSQTPLFIAAAAGLVKSPSASVLPGICLE